MTNLYSSAVFVGWGAVVLGVILERIYRDSVGLVMAATIGFVTQIIAHNLALGGDTMEMMRAVLDSNFWLTTHVITITLGYSATYVAGFLGILFVLRGVLTRGLGPETRAALNRMVYGTLCFATLFSFVGTVLGGIWADQSWGRFWGWDPKENGALIIVLWNAFDPPRALGRPDPRTRSHEPRHLRQHRHQLLLVWRQHVGRGPALLWFHGQGRVLALHLHRQPTPPHRPGLAPPQVLGQPARRPRPACV
ncbi:MAG: cytochrome c biogenesis protein CcsA [Verrucomicrobia bacterium]|nr:cytochrome c biogenesis protein CcsA [Verrucomicrobiota bacterium]